MKKKFGKEIKNKKIKVKVKEKIGDVLAMAGSQTIT